MARTKSKLHPLELTWNIIKYSIVGLIGLLIIIVFGLYLFGFRYMIVVTGSMEPNLPVGTLAISRPAKFKDLKIGDIVTKDSNGVKLTHRIVSVTEEGYFITKGDANQTLDTESPITPNTKLVGVVWFNSPFMGKVVRTASGNPILAIGVIIGITGSFILLSYLVELIIEKSKDIKEE